MEKIEQTYQSVYRAAVPVNRLVPAEAPKPKPKPAVIPRARKYVRARWLVLSGEARLRLVQIGLSLVLTAAVAVGAWIGGESFQSAWDAFLTRGSVDLRSYFEPVTPDGVQTDAEHAPSSVLLHFPSGEMTV